MRFSATVSIALACLVGDAFATTAIITRPANTMHIALYTEEQFSALDSWVGTSSPPDCAMRIGSAEWTFGDSSSGYGFEVRHVYASAGTYTVTLTVYDDLGYTATQTTSVTVVSMANWGSGIQSTKYIRSDGHDDTTTSGDYNSNDPITGAWKTLERYFYFARNNMSHTG